MTREDALGMCNLNCVVWDTHYHVDYALFGHFVWHRYVVRYRGSYLGSFMNVYLT